MDIKGNTVTFTLDDKSLHMLQLSLLLLDKNGDALFNEFIERNCYLAMRNSMEGSPRTAATPFARVDRLSSEDKAKRRIEAWSARKNFVNYNIIKSYFDAKGSSEDGSARREAMVNYFLTYDFAHDDRKNKETFIRNFRMMCSDAAYGLIFRYNPETDEVTVSKEIEGWLIEHKDMFSY